MEFVIPTYIRIYTSIQGSKIEYISYTHELLYEYEIDYVRYSCDMMRF